MKEFLRIILLGFFVLTYGCSEENLVSENEESLVPVETVETVETVQPVQNGESFLPMQIGNYWKHNEDNYTEITDTLRIQGNLFYKFYSLIGRDGIFIQYLRIDEHQNLVRSNPEHPDSEYLHAKFNAPLGSTFWTRNDQSENDLKVTVIAKEDSLRTFEFQRFYDPNSNDTRTVTYIKGLGWNNYNEIKIDGNVFHY